MSQPSGESFYRNLGQPRDAPVPDYPQVPGDGAHPEPGGTGDNRPSRDDHGGNPTAPSQESQPDPWGARGQGHDDSWWNWSSKQHSWWGYSWGDGSRWGSAWEPQSRDYGRRWSQDETWGTGSTESGSAAGCQGNGSVSDERQHAKDDSVPPPAHNGGDPQRDLGGLPDGWKPTALPSDLRGNARNGLSEGGRGPSEKMVVPSFSGTADAGDENLGQTARSYLRQIAAWRRMTRLAPEAQGLTYLISWVKDRYLDVEITQVGRCLSDFFRKLRRKPGQSVRDYLSDFDRSLARLNEVGCILPDLAAAWVLVDRMGLEESAELNLLASVGNVYNLKLLQQASIVQDRTLRKPWENSSHGRPWNKKVQSAMMAGSYDEEEADDFGEEATGEEADNGVPEAVASELYEAYVTHETARQKYRDTLKLRGSDPDGMREAMHQKLQAAKQRSFCSACKRRGHWHKDPQCPLNQGKTASSMHPSSTGGTTGSGSGPSSPEKIPKVNFPCHVVHVTWDLNQSAEASSLLGITDTACSKSVAGVPWVESYLNEARKIGFRPPFLEAKESFKFGASRVFEALYSIVLTFDIGGRPIMVRISVVNGDVPLLLSRPVLGKLGMVLDVDRNTADFRELRVQELQLVITDTGHPAVPVKPIYVDSTLAQGGDWNGPEVKILSERAQYTVFALETVCVNNSDIHDEAPESNEVPNIPQPRTSTEGPLQITYNTPRTIPRPRNENAKDEPSIFYPKKLGVAVKGMLLADKLRAQRPSRVRPIVSIILYTEAGATPRTIHLSRCFGSEDQFLAVLECRATTTFRNSKAPMASRSAPLLTAPTVTKQKTLWELTKDELIAEAQARHLQYHPKWTAAEIRQVIQEDRERVSGPTAVGPPPALSKMTLEQLKTAVTEAGLSYPERTNKASLMRILRDNGGMGAQTILSFGRFKGCMYQETAPSYRVWAMNETDANPGAQEDLKMFAAWCRRDQDSKRTASAPVTMAGYVDSEETATVPYTPDPFEQWDMVGSRTEADNLIGVIDLGDGPGIAPSALIGERPGPGHQDGAEIYYDCDGGSDKENGEMRQPPTKYELDPIEMNTFGGDDLRDSPGIAGVRTTTRRSSSVNGAPGDHGDVSHVISPTKYQHDPVEMNTTGGPIKFNFGDLGFEDDYEAAINGSQDFVEAYHAKTIRADSDAVKVSGAEFDCENLAKDLYHSRAFGCGDLLRLFEKLPMKVTKRHREINADADCKVRSFLGGMWTHGGLRGLSHQSRRLPWTVKYVNKAMRELSYGAWGDSVPVWTSFIITQNMQTKLHKDVHNLLGSQVLTMSLGEFENGRLWIEDLPGESQGEATFSDNKNHNLHGNLIDTKEKPYVFDPKRRHATGAWSGERWCISCFTTRGISDADQGERDALRAMCFPLRGIEKLIAPKPEHYVKADRPVKSVRKGMWKAAKRLVALTTVCSAAASSFTGETLPLPRGKDSVALLEIGGWTKTLEASDYNFLTAEPILPEDLYEDNFLDNLNETIRTLEPGTLWIHGDVVTGCLPQIGKIASDQVRKGRAVVVEAPEDATLWERDEIERVREEAGLLLEKRNNGRRELRINVAQSSHQFAYDEDIQPFRTYLAAPTTRSIPDSDPYEVMAVTGGASSSTEERISEARGASAITFSEGKKIPAPVQSSLKRLHQNLGHPTAEDLGRHLRLAGSSPEVVEAAKRLRCQVCDRHHRGKSAKPSSMPTLLEFNQLVAVDAFSVYDVEHVRVEFLLVIDIGTGFCVARQLEGHSGEALEKVFCDAWASTFGPPGSMILDLETGLQAGLARFSEWHGTWIRPIAAQAHYQQGSVERCIRSWKQLWEKVCDEKSVVASEAAMAATVINSAMNSLRRSSGTSPAQAVWGREPRLPEDLTHQAEADHFESVLSRDRLRAREFALRMSARTAYYKCQGDTTLRRALNHRSRVAGPELAVGDHVFIYRKPKSQKFWEWYGPGVVIGKEGPNWWVSYSGRCHLTAPEHLRVASGEEIGAAFSLHATRDDLEKLLEADFDDETLYVDDLEEAVNVEGEHEVTIDGEDGKKGPGEDPEPPGHVHAAHMAKFAKTARGREKALEKEIPWSLIPQEVQGLFKDAEAKQYLEHRQHEALIPLSVEESREVTKTKGDRILPSRFAYRDKHWSKRKQDAKAPWKPKARLVIGGHRDPDLMKGLNTHAPTISRQGILLLLQILASNMAHGWTGHAGDVTAAFLSGETLVRELFLRQPKTGLGDLHPEQLLRIRKPIFGLVDSPAAWWQKLSGTLKEMTLSDEDGKQWIIRQCELDNCIFTVHQVFEEAGGKITYGKPQAYLGIHVDDILLIGNDKLCALLKRELSKKFPIDEWESGSFDYVGSYIDIREDYIKVSQESYVSTRLFQIDVERGAKDWEPATETQRLDNMSLIGALSWLASQSRPDLQVGVSMSQQCQRDPCVGDIRFTNLLAQRALEHQQEGVYIYPVDFEKAILLCYHDAGWANCPQDQDDPHYALDDEEEKQGMIEGGPHSLLSRKAKKANSSIASQLGCFFVFGNDGVLAGERTPMSILDWKSGACERVCRSTFQAETMACAYGIETSEYILKFLQTLLDGDLVRGPTKFPARFIRSWWEEIKKGIKLTFREEKILNQCKSRSSVAVRHKSSSSSAKRAPVAVRGRLNVHLGVLDGLLVVLHLRKGTWVGVLPVEVDAIDGALVLAAIESRATDAKEDYEEAALLWEQSVAVQKRYLCGPRLAAELGGAAKRLVVGKRADWLSHNDGVTVLLQHLRNSLGRPQVSELTEHLSRFFKGSRKRPTEGMNDYITRKSEVYLRACQALRRVAPLHKKGQGTTGRMWSRRSSGDYSYYPETENEEPEEAGDGQEAQDGSTTTASTTRNNDQWNAWNPYWGGSWWSSGWNQGYWNYGGGGTWGRQASTEPEDSLPDLLPDFVQGWYLLHDAGLDHMSRNLVMTALQGDFSYMKVAQELRNQFGDEHKKRDFTKNPVYMGDYQDTDDYPDGDTYEIEEDEALDDDEKAMWNEAEESAQEAMAALQVAKKTLKEARYKQHAVKMARQFYKPNMQRPQRPRSSGDGVPARDDSKMTCLRCGKVGHRAANCSQPPQAAKVTNEVPEDNPTSSFVCYSETENLAMSVGLSTDEAVKKGMAVIDGGATKTLSSIAALEHIMKRNMQEKGFDGLVGMSLQDRPLFSFGNGTQDRCASTVQLRLDAAEKRGELTVHCLDRGEGPLLLSIDALRLIKVERSQTGPEGKTEDEKSLGRYMANLNKMTKAALQDELFETYGEKAPTKWTKLELKARINELRGDEEVAPTSGSTLQDRTRDLRKAAKKKSDLIEFCRHIQVELNGNETMAVMESRALRRLQETCKAGPQDFVGFGKYSHLQYINILTGYEEYGRWAKQMYKEDPEGNSTDPRLRRLAQWLLDNEDQKDTERVKRAPREERRAIAGREPGQSSTSSAPTTTTGNPSLESVIHEQNKRMDQMANVIELLRTELTATRGERPRKGAERREDSEGQKDEDAYMTEGSYSLVSDPGNPKSTRK
ncbi:GIP [Symbiodinium sp. CCMP2592]|nr:GIP [Symbiodinium sp. CCMP2592]